MIITIQMDETDITPVLVAIWNSDYDGGSISFAPNSGPILPRDMQLIHDVVKLGQKHYKDYCRRCTK